MFVRVDAGTLGANILKWMQGVQGLVSFGGVPAILPNNFIDHLRQHMETLATEDIQAKGQLQPGDSVTIVEGPFAGYEAVFDKYLSGKDRVQVLLAFLSSYPQPMKLDKESVQKRAKHQE
jgi:transcriptional antiterminator RfaH